VKYIEVIEGLIIVNNNLLLFSLIVKSPLFI